MLWHSQWWLVHASAFVSCWGIVGDQSEATHCQHHSTSSLHDFGRHDHHTSSRHYTPLLYTTQNRSIWHFMRFSEPTSHPIPFATLCDALAMTDLRRRAAFDIGSAATKLMIADIAGSTVVKDCSDCSSMQQLLFLCFFWFLPPEYPLLKGHMMIRVGLLRIALLCWLVLAFCFGAGAFCEGDPRSLCNWLETIQRW